MAKYIGNKSIVPLYPNILGVFPPHKRYVELFAGSAQIAQKKKHVNPTVLVDKNVSAIPQTYLATNPGIEVINNCAISWLKTNSTGMVDTLIYLDPPYIISERRCQKELYDFELTEADHVELLTLLRQSAAMVVISHYDCSLYNEILHDWEKKVVKVSYRGYVMKEAIYYNFPAAGVLHSTTHAGKNKTDRQRIKRKAARWADNFNALPKYEQQAILERLIIK